MPTCKMNPIASNPDRVLAYLNCATVDRPDDSTIEIIDVGRLIAMTDELVATGAIQRSKGSGNLILGSPVLPSLRRDFSEISEA